MRIASLLASGTELVCALGAGDELVGRSHECDHPPWVERLPICSRPTFAIDGSSGQIDRLVRGKLRAGQPLYEIDEAQLTALAPDVVITQTHCEVCAVTPSALGDGACGPSTLRRNAVVALRAGTLQEILTGFVEVARVIGRAEAGAKVVAELQEKLQRCEQKVREPARSAKPTIVCLEWLDPLFAMGNWETELVRLAGGEDLLGAAGLHSTTTPWQAVHDVDPDVLLVAPCGFGIERTRAEMPTLETLPGWRDLRAVRTGRVIVADGNRFFNRSGPSVFETIDILEEVLHPAAGSAKHEGSAWIHHGVRQMLRPDTDG